MKESSSVSAKPQVKKKNVVHSQKSVSISKQQPQQRNKSGAQNSWSRLGLRVSSAEHKISFLSILSTALSSGCKRGRDFILGTNSISKHLEDRNLAVLCIAKDSHPCLHNHLVEAAHALNVPIIIFPKLVDNLSLLLKVKRVSCLGMPGTGGPIGDAAHDCSHDAARDYLVALFASQRESNSVNKAVEIGLQH